MSDEQSAEAETEAEAEAGAPEPKKPKKKKSKRPQWTLFAVVSLLSLLADQATKIWARGSLPTEGHPSHGLTCAIPDDIVSHVCMGSRVSVLGNFWDWQLSMNPGSAFGMFGGGEAAARIGLSVVGILAVIGMMWMLKRARTDQRVLHWALALVAGGAVGNLVDRIYYGVVTDFILWHYEDHFWPTFNVADVVLVIGVGLMFIDIQKEGKRDKARRKKRLDKAKRAGLVTDLDAPAAPAAPATDVEPAAEPTVGAIAE